MDGREFEVFKYGSINHKMSFVSDMQRHLQNPYPFGKTESRQDRCKSLSALNHGIFFSALIYEFRF